jgi:outer membrane protein assembly factor BamB
VLKRWLTSFGSLLLLGACRMLAPADKRPTFHGAIREPVWTVEGIAAESLEVCAGVVLVIGRQHGEQTTRLFALDTTSGRRLWTSTRAMERVVALGQRTAFVLVSSDRPPDPDSRESPEALHSRLRWIDLSTGRDLDFSRNWTPFGFHEGSFYGFDAENYLVSIDEEGRTRLRAYTAFASPLHFAISNQKGPGEVAAALGRTPDRRQQRLVVFDRRTLRALWATVLPLPEDWVGRTDLLVADGGVFVREYEIHVEGDTATTRGFDARSGKKLWQRVDPGETRGEDGLLWVDRGALLLKKPYQGYTVASAISGMERQGMGYEPSPFFVTGIDPHTGTDLWTASLYTRGHEDMVGDGGLLYTRDMKYYAVIDEAGTATRASWLTCVDPATSTEVWRSRVMPETYYTKPAVEGNLVFVGGRPYRQGRGRAVILALKTGR